MANVLVRILTSTERTSTFQVISRPGEPPIGDLGQFASGGAHVLPELRMKGLLLNFAYLQVLDLLTTSAFLLAGVREANPFVVFAMRLTSDPIAGLASVKALALLLGLFCWKTSRTRLLKTATAFYAVLVAYNLVCLILGLSAR
jgi:hypothetical protein